MTLKSDHHNLEQRTHVPVRVAIVAIITAIVFLTGIDTVFAGPKPRMSDGRPYEVSSVQVAYERESGWLPSSEELMDIEVQLGETENGFVAPREDVPIVTVRLGDIQKLGQKRFYATAIRAINQSIVNEFTRRGYMDIYVAPAKGQFAADGSDLRSKDAPLKLKVRLGQVTDLSTSTTGDRFGEGERNNAAHQRILDRSPLGPSDEYGRPDVIRKQDLDDYLFFLNRHPGRQVDATLSPSRVGRGVLIDYVVNENKPWIGYVQFSNTGTELTNKFRQRFGFVNHQLTDRDDTLSIDYITAGFDDLNAIMGAYEAPFFDVYRGRWKVNASFSEFTSSDVGIFNSEFKGDDWSIGGDFFYNFLQRRELFFDWFVGARWRSISAENVGIGGNGEDDYFLPHLGLRAERMTPTMRSTAHVELEWNMEDIASTSTEDSALLGRSDPDVDFAIFSWNFAHSFYVEPLLNRAAWEDPSTPESSTLVHEVAVSFRGQHAFNNRLIPHEETIVGGLYSVRGYEESLLAADGALITSIEYRLHIPRMLDPDPSAKREVFGKEFKWARGTTYGRPDWDLVAKAFLDGGRTILTDKSPNESQQTLIGAGVGLELILWRNLNVRVDLGYALTDADELADKGDTEFHIVASFLF